MANIFSLTARGASKAFTAPSFYRQQAAALCCRQDGDNTEVLLITGRGNASWGIPKGTIELGEQSAQAAEREAFEEAGIRGKCHPHAVGIYHYFKTGRLVPYEVHVHILRVDEVTDDFPEVEERSLEWTPLRHASGFVARPGLARLLGELGSEVDHHLNFDKLRLASN